MIMPSEVTVYSNVWPIVVLPQTIMLLLFRILLYIVWRWSLHINNNR